MSKPMTPRLPKWPFYVADLALFGTAAFIYYQSGSPKGIAELTLIAACVASAALLSVVPFWLDYRASAKLAEAEALTAAVAQIKNMEKVAAQIDRATGQWQSVQEQANQTANIVKQITACMTAEAKGFIEFIERASDNEKATLRLEVEKLRRAEGDWVQVLVRMLDHVYALHQGAVHSGQANVVNQVSQFQNACRDVARRVGLTPFTAVSAERFDAQRHRLMEGNGQQPKEGTIAETLAAGYTFQGKLLRHALVRLEQNQKTESSSVAPAQLASHSTVESRRA